MANGAANAVDRVARLIALLSLAVSGAELFYSFLQGPAVRASVGPTAHINSYRRVGVSCTLTNSGAQQAVITSAVLRWKEPETVFKGVFLSTSLEKYKIEKGRQVLAEPIIYTPFAPLAVKQRDQVVSIVWFTATDERFQFKPGSHECTLEVYSRTDKLAETTFWIRLDEPSIHDLQAYPDQDWPVEVHFTKPN